MRRTWAAQVEARDRGVAVLIECLTENRNLGRPRRHVRDWVSQNSCSPAAVRDHEATAHVENRCLKCTPTGYAADRRAWLRFCADADADLPLPSSAPAPS
ncbi:hypothetical protein [Streptomyces sp. SLBN-115]|uniref:hypothetical protein n=1 Tax=Streptomyces sp. SLBN-115 TaxID=2768453 RepID=UPI001151E983|nr:hypothetical protein [Streptomyces sp. SLBN-115]TQJ38010.1 hypothetical protein FBY34_8185 [Streptomyces sp. SLBN-115]